MLIYIPINANIFQYFIYKIYLISNNKNNIRYVFYYKNGKKNPLSNPLCIKAIICFVIVSKQHDTASVQPLLRAITKEVISRLTFILLSFYHPTITQSSALKIDRITPPPQPPNPYLAGRGTNSSPLLVTHRRDTFLPGFYLDIENQDFFFNKNSILGFIQLLHRITFYLAFVSTCKYVCMYECMCVGMLLIYITNSLA